MVKVYLETSFEHLPGEIEKTKSNFNQVGQISNLDMNPETCEPPAPDLVVPCCTEFHRMGT